MNSYNLAVATGAVPNHLRVHKFAYNDAVGNTKETIWAHGGVINWPAGALTLKAVSSSAVDAAAGTGVRTVKFFGHDASWGLVDTTITLNGQTPVNFPATWTRVYRGISQTAGSGGTNAGVIYVYTGDETAGVPDTATLIYSTIEVGDGQTLQGSYTIPAGYTGYLAYLAATSFGTANPPIQIDVEARAGADQSDSLFVIKDRFLLKGSNFVIDASVGLPDMAEMTDFMVSGTSSGVAGDVSVIFDIVLVKT